MPNEEQLQAFGWSATGNLSGAKMGDVPAELFFPLMHLCEALELPADEEHSRTPYRVAKWFQSFARKPNLEEKPEFFSVTFPSPHKELVWESGLSFVALCPHHLLPYSGVGAIGYIPSSSVVGISKLGRALDYYTHYPVKQEDATANLADAIMRWLQPEGCMVVLKAYHTCMGLRGVKQPNHITGTSAVRGIFADDANGCRSEFIRLAGL